MMRSKIRRAQPLGGGGSRVDQPPGRMSVSVARPEDGAVPGDHTS
jgi:hypothetical protein